ncbi:pentatricopeptide repeat-containing protein mitochondrial [Spatholobus suberectus]|nr:pentatricopeptide repeat-containing protein mitochondrial [Spatholobus suberectus]
MHGGDMVMGMASSRLIVVRARTPRIGVIAPLASNPALLTRCRRGEKVIRVERLQDGEMLLDRVGGEGKAKVEAKEVFTSVCNVALLGDLSSLVHTQIPKSNVEKDEVLCTELIDSNVKNERVAFREECGMFNMTKL